MLYGDKQIGNAFVTDYFNEEAKAKLPNVCTNNEN